MAILTKGTTFADGDQVTSTKLNNLVDAATFVSGSSGSTDDATLEVNGSGRLQVKTIQTGNIANSAVTTAKIADSTGATNGITTAKIATGAVTTAKIADANVTPGKLSQPLTLETAKASTSGTSVDFTGIPSWAKRITVMFSGVSTSGTSLLVIRLGTSGGITSSGYLGSASTAGATINTQNWTSGFGLRGSVTAAVDVYHGNMTLTLSGSGVWISSHVMALSNVANTLYGAGSVTLSGTLDRIRVTTVNGTDTFDSGSINIMYE